LGVQHFGRSGRCATLENRVRELNYKTIRYPGHRDYMAFSSTGCARPAARMPDIWKMPFPTFQDVVVILQPRNRVVVQISDARKIYGQTINEEPWSAIQITTAAGVCAVVDLHGEGKLLGQGLVRQEQVGLDDFLNNRFGQHYKGSNIYSRYMGVGDFAEIDHDTPA
jgi:saccharopine dehydrogenase-like NADP-dependent oxidoreductase